MKKHDLIKSLVLKQKLLLVDPSTEVSNSYAKKSENSLKASTILLSYGLLEEATSHIYYAMYYKVLSLLFKLGIKSKNHTGSIFLLQELSGISTKSILVAKKERIEKQYYVDFRVTEEEVGKLFDIAQQFVSEIDFYISKLTYAEVQRARNTFSALC